MTIRDFIHGWRKLLYFVVGLVITALGLTQVVAEDNILDVNVPTENVDGSPLTDLSSIRYFHSTNQGGPYALIGEVPHVGGATTSTFTHSNQLDALHCYVATAVDGAGGESDNSNEACKIVDTILPGSPGGLTVR